MALSKYKIIKKICKRCDRVYYVFPYQNNKSSFCSKKCSTFQDQGKLIKKECVICTSRFKTYQKTIVCCSKKCFGINQRAERHPNWVGGTWGYIKNIILIEQNYTCQNCGLREPEIMEVNHKLERSQYPELARDKNNLEVLCPNCHRRKTNLFLRNLKHKNL